jgi:retron-type reverse transcriptase
LTRSGLRANGCWRYDWVLDIDIKGFFDSIDWVLLLKAVRNPWDCSTSSAG